MASKRKRNEVASWSLTGDDAAEETQLSFQSQKPTEALKVRHMRARTPGKSSLRQPRTNAIDRKVAATRPVVKEILDLTSEEKVSTLSSRKLRAGTGQGNFWPRDGAANASIANQEHRGYNREPGPQHDVEVDLEVGSKSYFEESEMEVPYAQNLGLPGQSQHIVAELLSDVKTEPLRPGDVIFYHNPVFVAGSKNSIRVAQVLKIDSSHEIPLQLDNGECIPACTSVKRIKEHRKGQLYDHRGLSRPIENFRLSDGSWRIPSGEASGIRKQVAQLQAMFTSARENFLTKDTINMEQEDDDGDESSLDIMPLPKRTSFSKKNKLLLDDSSDDSSLLKRPLARDNKLQSVVHSKRRSAKVMDSLTSDESESENALLLPTRVNLKSPVGETSIGPVNRATNPKAPVADTRHSTLLSTFSSSHSSSLYSSPARPPPSWTRHQPGSSAWVTTKRNVEDVSVGEEFAVHSKSISLRRHESPDRFRAPTRPAAFDLTDSPTVGERKVLKNGQNAAPYSSKAISSQSKPSRYAKSLLTKGSSKASAFRPTVLESDDYMNYGCVDSSDDDSPDRKRTKLSTNPRDDHPHSSGPMELHFEPLARSRFRD